MMTNIHSIARLHFNTRSSTGSTGSTGSTAGTGSSSCRGWRCKVTVSFSCCFIIMLDDPHVRYGWRLLLSNMLHCQNISRDNHYQEEEERNDPFR